MCLFIDKEGIVEFYLGKWSIVSDSVEKTFYFSKESSSVDFELFFCPKYVSLDWFHGEKRITSLEYSFKSKNKLICIFEEWYSHNSKRVAYLSGEKGI